LATKGTFENKGFLRELDFHTIAIRRHYKPEGNAFKKIIQSFQNDMNIPIFMV
jgi:hypothetical protein